METVTIRRNATNEKADIQVIRWDELDPESIQAGQELNFVTENFTERFTWEDVGLMFGPMNQGEQVVVLPQGINWPRLLADLKCFQSASQAAKDRKARKLPLDIEEGWHDFHIGKARKVRISLWKPYFGEGYKPQSEADLEEEAA